jgi:hypothetical protein
MLGLFPNKLAWLLKRIEGHLDISEWILYEPESFPRPLHSFARAKGPPCRAIGCFSSI